MELRSKVRLTRPFTQNLIVGVMLFCLPGMYNAITGLGAGGGKPSSLEVANNVNAILYLVLAAGSLVVGSVLNILKPRLCLMLGAAGYPLYIGGLWYFDRSGHSWFVYLSGVLNGISGAFLWTTAAYIQFSYPEERQKGTYISTQWAMRSAGATVGALIAFGANFHKTKAVGVSTGVYIAFIIIQLIALVVAGVCIVDPRRVQRDDGTNIAIFKREPLVKELKGLLLAAADRRYVILIIPMVSCEMALGFVSSVNSRSFNLRTRALNNAAFNIIQMFIPPILSFILDSKHVKSRRHRGFLALAFIGPITIGGAAGILAWIQVHQISYSGESRAWDWLGSQWGGLFVCYIMFGCVYSGFQMVTEYTLSATTNDPQVLAKVAGLFKFYSSLGMFLSFILAAQKVPFVGQAGLGLGLYFISCFCIIYILWKGILETNYFTEANVIVPIEVITLQGMSPEEMQQQGDQAQEKTATVVVEGSKRNVDDVQEGIR